MRPRHLRLETAYPSWGKGQFTLGRFLPQISDSHKRVFLCRFVEPSRCCLILVTDQSLLFGYDAAKERFSPRHGLKFTSVCYKKSSRNLKNMIINYSVENWRSFRNQVTLNMTAGLERQHRNRVQSVDKFNLHLLPISAIYGANASGKTKLIDSLVFLKNFAVFGNVNEEQKINIHRFKLDPVSITQPTKFAIDLLINELIFSYKVSLLPECVVEESLTVANSRTVYDVFKRNSDNRIIFDKDFFKTDRYNLMPLIAKAARKNQLFLTTGIQLGADEFKPLYDWFAKTLTIIRPTSEYISIHRFVDSADSLNQQMIDLTRKLGTGIDHFEAKTIDNSNDQDFSSVPREFVEHLKEKIPKGMNSIRIMDLFTVNNNDETVVKKLYAIHKNCQNEDIPFSLKEESDGTQRLLNLIPAFVDLHNNYNQVYVIDELDRSLHTKLSEWLLRYFLESCNNVSRNQLIFTTHDVNLLTQDIFRRDELWGVDKHDSGISDLYSFRDFKEIRTDSDIRKIYLNGLVGGVPNID